MIAQQYDPVKWAKSAAASKRIIDSGIYSLYTVPSDENTYASSQASQAEFPLGVGGIDPYHSYIDMVQRRSTGSEKPGTYLCYSLEQQHHFNRLPVETWEDGTA